MRKKSFLINMTVLYILVGVVFFLITGMNIYAYRIIVGMGESYANLAGTLQRLPYGVRDSLFHPDGNR